MKTFNRVLVLVLILCMLPVAVFAAETTDPTLKIGIYETNILPKAWGPFADASDGKDLILDLTTVPFYNLSESGVFSASLAGLPEDITAEYEIDEKFGISKTARRGHVFRIDLNPNIYWEDGSKVTAKDVQFTLISYARQNALDITIAGMDDYLQGVRNPSGVVGSLQQAGFASVEEAKEAGHHHFYLDMTHFWGLDEGWVSIESRTAFHDRAIPTGVNEMYITPAYLYQQYLRDGGRQDHLQSEFIGIAGDTMPMTEKDIGVIVKDNHQLILILEEPTTVTALTAELSKLIIVKEDRFGLGYGSSVSSYCSYGPYKVTAVNPREIILQPNEAWKNELPYDVDQIRISPAA